MTVLSDAKRQDITVRFKKTADGVYVEAKRSAIGGMTQVPFYFYVLLLVLGWNEIVAGKFLHPFTWRGVQPGRVDHRPPDREMETNTEAPMDAFLLTHPQSSAVPFTS